MADLQSFFAKKDKKKKSKKAETFTPDDLMKKIEQDTQGLADPGYDSNGDTKNPPKNMPLNLPNAGKDDEEWNEFETDKEVDLSTLKIQNLGEKEKERQEENEQESLKKAVEESKSTMKWNIPQGESSDEEDNEAADEKADPEGKAAGEQGQDTGEKESPKTASATNEATETSKSSTTSTPHESNKYIAPALRAVLERREGPPSQASGPSLAPTSLRRSGNHSRNLDVNSTDQFPSLSATVNSAGGAWGAGAPGQDGAGVFTSVRKGARGPTDGGPDQSGLSTSNKYSMLKSQNRT